MNRHVTAQNLGAWLLKGNADVGDLDARLAADPWVGGWCVRPGYRVRMMTGGQPVVLWASGSRRARGYGVWGVGRVTGPPVPGRPGQPWTVPLDLAVLDPPDRVPRAVLRADPRLVGAEVLRQPMGANPSWLTVAEYAALCEHLPPPGDRTGRDQPPTGRHGPVGAG
ncbi:hypothetical protein [Micromonospora sp. KC721]|uniref:hypothetical protein n=1 Tax=Micromonospora sp. KC721 TaxID=2530380 RepID=UPI001A9FFCA5|nr:hypothetical protein [Micromonospora sp. KC721]